MIFIRSKASTDTFITDNAAKISQCHSPNSTALWAAWYCTESDGSVSRERLISEWLRNVKPVLGVTLWIAAHCVIGKGIQMGAQKQIFLKPHHSAWQLGADKDACEMKQQTDLQLLQVLICSLSPHRNLQRFAHRKKNEINNSEPLQGDPLNRADTPVQGCIIQIFFFFFKVPLKIKNNWFKKNIYNIIYKIKLTNGKRSSPPCRQIKSKWHQ